MPPDSEARAPFLQQMFHGAAKEMQLRNTDLLPGDALLVVVRDAVDPHAATLLNIESAPALRWEWELVTTIRGRAQFCRLGSRPRLRATRLHSARISVFAFCGRGVPASRCIFFCFAGAQCRRRMPVFTPPLHMRRATPMT